MPGYYLFPITRVFHRRTRDISGIPLLEGSADGLYRGHRRLFWVGMAGTLSAPAFASTAKCAAPPLHCENPRVFFRGHFMDTAPKKPLQIFGGRVSDRLCQALPTQFCIC